MMEISFFYFFILYLIFKLCSFNLYYFSDLRIVIDLRGSNLVKLLVAPSEIVFFPCSKSPKICFSKKLFSTTNTVLFQRLFVWWYYIFLMNNKSTYANIGTTISLVKGKMIFWSTYKFCLEIFYVLWIRFGAWNCLLYLVSSIFNSYSICSRIMTLLRPSMENDLQSQALKV